jgi:hypothetical protein
VSAEELSNEMLPNGPPLDTGGVEEADGSDEPNGAEEETSLDSESLDESAPLLCPLEVSSLGDISLEEFDEDERSSLLLDEELLLSLAEELSPLEFPGPELDDETSAELELTNELELDEDEDDEDNELLLDELDELELLDSESLLDALSLDMLLLEDEPLKLLLARLEEELLLEDELLELLLLLEVHSQSCIRRSKRHSPTLDTSCTVSVRLSTSMHSWQGAGVKRNSCTVSPGGGGLLELLLESEELSLLELLDDELLDELVQSQQQQQPASWLCSHGPSDLLSMPPSSLIVTSRL